MSDINTTFITIEQMEAATDALLENGKKVGADSWQQRVKNQTPHCKFGEEGICCRICSMGPCRITPKAPRGICGCDADGIVGRNYCASPPAARRRTPITAAASPTRSTSPRKAEITRSRIPRSSSASRRNGTSRPRTAISTTSRTRSPKPPAGIRQALRRAALPEARAGSPPGIWHREGIEPRAIDREVSQSMHMTHMGCSPA